MTLQQDGREATVGRANHFHMLGAARKQLAVRCSLSSGAQLRKKHRQTDITAIECTSDIYEPGFLHVPAAVLVLLDEALPRSSGPLHMRRRCYGAPASKPSGTVPRLSVVADLEPLFLQAEPTL